MPETRLCPPIPNRLNYVRWLHHTLLPQHQHHHQHHQHHSNHNNNPDYFHATFPTHHVDEKGVVVAVPPAQRHVGLDIGTGASCIYPLLFVTYVTQQQQQQDGEETHALSSGSWNMLATEVDGVSAAAARANVQANQLQDKIHVVLVKPTDAQQQEEEQLLSATTETRKLEQDSRLDHPADVKSANQLSSSSKSLRARGPIACAMEATLSDEAPSWLDSESTISGHDVEKGRRRRFDFCMTNPPFYDSADAEATTRQRMDDRSRTPMTLSEGTYPNKGEVGFVLDMVRDSLYYRTDICWYTSMVGKKSTLDHVENILGRDVGLGITNVQTTTFRQGKQWRWGIAWTFSRPSIRSPLARVDHVGLKEFKVVVRHDRNAQVTPVEEVAQRICSYCNDMAMKKSIPIGLKCVILDSRKDTDGTWVTRTVVTISQDMDTRNVVSSSCTKNSDSATTTIPNDNTSAKKSIFAGIDLDWIQQECVPHEGPFWIELTLHSDEERTSANDSYTTSNASTSCCTQEGTVVHVSSQIYCHTRKGHSVVQQICGQMEGEVARTNRRWRRQLSGTRET
eukprot:scaffold30393_cov47-Attheya_sp.AAC.2